MKLAFVQSLTYWAPAQEVQGWIWGGQWLASTFGWVHGYDIIVVGYNAHHSEYRLLRRCTLNGDMSPYTVGEVITD